jgi:hypothetical protein
MQKVIKEIFVVGRSNTDLVARVKALPAEGETLMGRGFNINLPAGKDPIRQ